MKYEIELHRHESRRIIVFANDPAHALQTARLCNAGFTADRATELLDGDEPGNTFELMATCEACSRSLFNDDPHVTTEDGISLCPDCIPPQ